MEDLCLRYPHIFEMILSNLDNQTLANCKSVSKQFSVSMREWKDFMDNNYSEADIKNTIKIPKTQ